MRVVIGIQRTGALEHNKHFEGLSALGPSNDAFLFWEPCGGTSFDALFKVQEMNVASDGEVNTQPERPHGAGVGRQ